MSELLKFSSKGFGLEHGTRYFIFNYKPSNKRCGLHFQVSTCGALVRPQVQDCSEGLEKPEPLITLWIKFVLRPKMEPNEFLSLYTSAWHGGSSVWLTWPDTHQWTYQSMLGCRYWTMNTDKNLSVQPSAVCPFLTSKTNCVHKSDMGWQVEGL